MTLEHEGWHVEMLLYMLIQRAGTGTLPLLGSPSPWEALASQWNATTRPPSTPTVTLGATTITFGHDDSEGDDFAPGVAGDVKGHTFGWDNESPARTVEVAQFKLEWRPITNAEYLAFWETHREVAMPSSWVQEEDGVKVRGTWVAPSRERGRARVDA
ncbi:hypothetical protein BV22DRAFT_920366 [Leucogyrophana mollusca]|uniref:Uncharacterized protein n=1 Tax=Leucogyrophana mollusca TaxID=85980 RepID=A0ACB8AX95_9AGAM|nr:hypothetical protein BV22DRAFT_920366 [Leucogyrophana mollusca]